MGVLIFDIFFIFIGVYLYETDKTRWGKIFLLVFLLLLGADFAIDFAHWQTIK